MKKIPMIILTVMLVALSVSPTSVRASDSFVAILLGANEVPPRDTDARGVITLKFSKEATELMFTLNVTSMDNVVGAHIHCGVPGQNRPVGVGLFSAAPAGGQFNGVLAQGVVTNPLAANGCGWTAVADVLAAVNAGGAYVNVHSNDGVDPINTGPGDFPGGEIRGQIR